MRHCRSEVFAFAPSHAGGFAHKVGIVTGSRPINALAGAGIHRYSLQSLGKTADYRRARLTLLGHRRVDEHIKEMPATLLCEAGRWFNPR
jgi:hypothetical protein